MTEARHYDSSPEQEPRTARVIRPDATVATQSVIPLCSNMLPSISTGAAQASRSLFSMPRWVTTTHDEVKADWRVMSPGVVATQSPSEGGLWIKLDTSHYSFWLWLYAGSDRMQLGDRVWHQYEGENRLLAWALAHETFLQHLSLLLNDVCTPNAISEETPSLPNEEDTLLCQWHFTAGSDSLSGRFYWMAEHWERVATNPLWQQPSSHSRPAWRSRLSVPCRLRLKGYRYDRDEVRQFDPGDCLMVTGTFRTGLALHLQPLHSPHFWKADIQTGQLIVKQGPETEREITEPSSLADTQPNGGPTPGLEVELTFELGGVTLPLETVERLQSGYVMELPEQLDQSRVKVRANGTCIGSGRLVTIGDHLGVQLIDLSNDGA